MNRGLIMPSRPYLTVAATQSVADQLADIRVAAMRPSLEAAGRFDPQRARDRFLRSFNPDETEMIVQGETIVGFYVFCSRSDHLFLDHLYILPEFQGYGIGKAIIQGLKEQARARGMPIRLMALNGSPANAFYQSLGFTLMSADALDSTYEWRGDRGAGGASAAG